MAVPALRRIRDVVLGTEKLLLLLSKVLAHVPAPETVHELAHETVVAEMLVRSLVPDVGLRLADLPALQKHVFRFS